MNKYLKYLTLLFLLTTNSLAFELSPMTLELVPDSGERNAVFTITNDSKKPIAVQIHLTKRVMSEFGKETNPDAGDKFLIFPDQLIVKSGEKRAIKVSYLEKGEIKEEEAFRFVAEQLPIDLDKLKKGQSTNIKILLKYRAAFYLSPEKGEGRVSLNSYDLNTKTQKLKMKVENKGNKHILLRKHAIAFKIGEIKYILKSEEMAGFFGENILAGSSRIFKLKIPRRLLTPLSKTRKFKVSLVKI